METLYRQIFYKLENILRAWHASDASTYGILSPLEIVFYPSSWEQLIFHFIFPKLMVVLQEFQINLSSQQLDQF